MKIQFVRYGGLSSVRQEGYDAAMPGFHSPPARRGIYAFVAQTVTQFLLGQDNFDPRRAEWVRDATGLKIPADSELALGMTANWSRHSLITRTAKDGKSYLARHKKPKFFSHVGTLWHHLPVARCDVIDEKGSWSLTSAETHKSAFARAFHKRRFARRQFYFHPAPLLDEFEVFIEKV